MTGRQILTLSAHGEELWHTPLDTLADHEPHPLVGLPYTTVSGRFIGHGDLVVAVRDATPEDDGWLAYLTPRGTST